MNRLFYTLCLKVVLVFVILSLSSKAYSQCTGLPGVLSSGSNKNPNALCSTVNADLSYSIRFTSALPAGAYTVVFFWGDGTAANSVPIAAGGTIYGPIIQNHTFPTNSDCEYLVQILIFKDGFPCFATLQNQYIQSYRTEQFNAGLVQLINPLTGNNFFDVCEGQNISAVFNDLTNFNCTSTYMPNYPTGQALIQTPNDGTRWEQFVYNTSVTAGPRIPNLFVNGIAVTGAGGAPIISNHQDTRGVLRMTSPVVINDPRRRNTLTMTAAGGFGPGFPVVGDIFEITIKYWNVCNPYSNVGTNVPVNGDLVNGDNPAIQAQAFIRIIDAPNAPTVNNPVLCETASNASFNITATGIGSGALTYTWYKDAALTQVLQATSADNTFNPVTEGPAPDRINKSVIGSQTFTRYVTVTQGGNNCTSPPATITIRIDDTNVPGTIAHPLGASPITICSGTDPAAFTGAGEVGGGPGGTVSYQWQQSSALAGPYSDILGATSAIFNPPAIASQTFFRRRERSGQCADVFSNVIEFKVDTPVDGGDIGTDHTICASPGDPANLTETTPASGGSNTGAYSYQWQSSIVSVAGPFGDIIGATSSTFDPPAGVIVPTFYRRRVTSGVCAGTNVDFSNSVVTVDVDLVVNPGSIGNPQTICSGQDPGILTSTTGPSGGDGTTYTIQWQQSATGGGVGFGAASGLNTALTYDPPVLASTTFYRRRTSSGVCSATFSNEIQVTVNPLPTAPNPTGGGSVCSGNPAPDIVWTGLTGTAPFQVTYRITKNPGAIVTNFGPIAVPTSTFTLASPNPGGVFGDIHNYQITGIVDANGCIGTSFGGFAQVIIGGAAPSFTLGPSLDISSKCFNDPISPKLIFTLDPGSFSSSGFTLNYTVDGSTNRTKVFNTTGVGAPTAFVSFIDAELNTTVPSPHIIRIVSLLSPSGCLTLVGINLNFTVNPLPAAPTAPVGSTYCSSTSPTVISATPAIGSTIDWYSVASGGTVLAGGTGTNSFIPPVAGNYFAESRNTTTGCLSSTRLSVTSTIDDAPALAAAGLDQNRCTTSATMAATAATNGGLGTWTRTSGTGTITSPNSPITTITGITQNAPGGAATVNVFRWTVTSALGVCLSSFDEVTITVNSLPTATDPLPQLCETLPGGGSTIGVDLTGFDASVTSHPLGAPTVAWFTDAARTIPVGSPTNITVIGPVRQFFFRATSAITTCQNTGQITFTVNPQPSAATPSAASRQFCEDVLGGNQKAGINLTTTFDNTITGGAANRSVAWFSDAALTTLVPTPTNYTLVGPQTLFARVTNTITLCTRTAQIDLSIKPRPAPNPIVGNASVCTGNNIILYQVDPSLNPGSTYTWSIVGTPPAAVQVFGGGGTNTANFFALLKFPAATGTVQIDVFETLNGCTGVTSNLLVNVNTAPAPNTITGLTQVCANQTGVNYNVTSPNATSTYTWTVTGASVAGAANDNINVDFSTISPVTIKVAETSITGCVGVDATTIVTVNPRPTMTSVNSATVCSGNAPSLNFTASIPSTFDWTVTGITGAIGGSLVGDTGTGNLNQVLVNNSGVVGSVTYAVTPTAIAAPNCDGASQSVTITVNPAPVLVNPQTKTICSGSQVNYEIVTTPLNLPSGTTFTWPAPTMSAGPAQGTGGSVAAGVPGTLHITDVLTNTTSASITATYTITPTSGLGCPGIPRTVVITIQPQPIVATTLNATRCSAANIGLVLATAPSSVAASNYNIISRSIAGGLTAGGGNSAVPATGTSTNYLANDIYKNLTTSSLNVTYAVVAVSAAGCIGSPQVITLTIDPEPALSNTLDLSICSSVATSLTLNTAPTSIAAASYNIVGVTIAPGLVPSGTNAVIPSSGEPAGYLAGDIFTNTTNASLTVIYQVVPVGAGGCGGDPPKSVTITVSPEPVISNTLNATVCSRSAIGLTLNTLATSVAAGNYNIVSRTVDVGLVAGGTNAAVPATGVPAGYLLSDVFTNTGSSPFNVTYRVVGRSASGCLGAFRDIVITINPEPVVSNSLNTLACSDDASGLVLNTNGTSVAAASYNITARSISGGLVANVSNAAVPATSVIDTYLSNDIFTNTGPTSLTVTYTVVPVSGAGCLGASKVITLTIDPEPVVATNLDGGVCSNVAIGLTLNTNGLSVAATNYNITARTIAPGLIANVGNVTVPSSGVGAAYLASDIFSNTGTTSLVVTYTVVPVSGTSCVGNPKVITLTVSPEPVMSNSLDASICSAVATGLTLNTNGTSVAAANYNITARTIAGGLVAAGSNVTVPATGAAANYLANDKFSNTTSSILTVAYSVVPISATGCPGPAKLITISINPEPVLSSSLSGSICSDVAIGLTLNTNGISAPAANYNITARTIAPGLIPGGSNASVPATGVSAIYLSNDVFANTGALPLNVTYTIVPISGLGCLGAPVVITKAVNPEPVVSTLLNTTICSDLISGLTLNTNGTSVAAASYDIVARTIAGGLLADGANAIVPATGVAASYLATDKFTNTGTTPLLVTYTVESISGASCVGNPQVITLTISPEPVVSTLLNSTNCSDSAIGLTLNTNGTSITAANYNVTARSISPGLVAAGANAAVPATAVGTSYLTNDRFNNTSGTALTVTYTVVPVAAGGCLGDPRNIIITINPEPVLLSTLNKTVCSDVATSLVLNTNGTSVAALNYNITSITIAGGLTAAGTNVSIPATGVNGNFIANDIFTNTGASALTVVYRVVPISASSCLGDPVDVIVTINPEPVVSTTLDVAVCSGIASGLNLNTNGTSVSAANYNITARNIAVGLVPGGSNVVVPASSVALGYLNADRFTNTGSVPLAVTYTVVPVSSATCIGKPRVVTVTINPEPVISPSLNASICSDISTGLTLSTNGTSVAAANYNITSRTIGIGLIAAGGNAPVPASTVAANYLANDKFTNNSVAPIPVTYTVVPISGIGCLGQPVVITQTINPEPVIANGLDKTVCSDAAVALTVNTIGSSVAAGSYNFTSRSVAGGLVAAGGNVTVPASGVAANYVVGDVFTNTGALALNVVYTIVPISGIGCLGDAKTITVAINPEPVISNALDAAICSGLATGLTLNTNGTSVVAQNYNITSRTIAPGLTAGGSNAVVPATGVASNYLVSDVFSNTGNASLTVTYTIVPNSSSNCLGDPKVVAITINPQPVVSTTLSSNVCSDLPIGLTLNTNGTSVAALTYDITNRAVAPGLTAAVTNAIVPSNGVVANFLAADKFTNVGNSNLTVVYTVVPISVAGCRGAAQAITMTINPEPVLATNLNKTVCSDVAGGITLNTNGISVAATNYNVTSVSIQAGLTTVSAAAIPGNGVAANYLAGDIYRNLTSLPLEVSYTVVPVSSLSCLGDPLVVKQIVNPEPVLGNLDTSVCSDQTIGLTLNTNGSSVAASTYNVTSRSIAGGLTAAGSNVAVPATGVAATYLFNDKFTNPGAATLNVTYTVVPVNGTCLGDPVVVTIGITPEPVLSSTLNAIVCSGSSSGITLATNGLSIAAASYNITAITPAGGLVALSGNATVANGVSTNYIQNDKFRNTGSTSLTVQYTVVPVAASGCVGDPVVVVLTVRPEPVMDPTLALKTICSRTITNITLNTNGSSVAAANYDVTLVSQDVGLTGTPTTGASLAANAILNDLFINVSSVPLKVVYQVTPRSAVPCIGSPFLITVTVNPEPVINPSLDNTVCSDAISNIVLSTNGTSAGAASYELVSLVVPGAITANVSNVLVGATGGINLIRNDFFTNTTAIPAVVVYGIRGISNASCNGQVQLINLTVNPKPVLDPLLNPTPVCSGIISNVTLGVAVGSVAAVTYNINSITFTGLTAGPGNSGIGSGKPANTILNDVYVNTTNSPLLAVYKIVPVSAGGCLGAEATVTLTINPSPALLANLDKTVCSNEASGITFGTKGTSIAAANYNIISVTIQAGLTQTTGNLGARTGVTANEVAIDQFQNPTNGVLTVTYKVEPVSAVGCRGPQVDVVLNVEPAVTMIIPPPASICSDTPNTPSATNILLDSNTIPSAGVITFDYIAVASPVGSVTGFFPAQGNLPRLTVIADKLVNNTNNVATVSYTITPKAVGAKGGAGCQTLTATTVVISVEPKPRLSITPATQVVCEGVATTMTLSTTTVPSAGTIQLTKVSAVPTGGMTLTSVPKTTYLNGEQIGDVWNNPTLVAQTVTYTFRSQIVGGLGCISDDITVLLTVNPTPAIVASAQAPICSTDFVNITLTPDVANTVATYTASAPPVITGASNGAGNLIFQTLFYNSLTPTVVNSDGPVIVNYTVTPKANNCTGSSIVVPVTVHPKPKILNVPSTIKVCHGNSLVIPLSSNVIGTNYTWTVDNPSGLPGVLDQVVPSPLGVNQILTNTTGVQASLTYTIKPFGPNACEGDQKTVIVTVAPEISASFQNLPSSICKGTSEFLIIQLNGQAPFSFVYNQNDGATSTDIPVTGAGNFKVIQVTPLATTTYTLKSVTDAFGCPFTVPVGQSVTITVGDTDPTFAIVGPTKACGPFQFQFQYNQKAGTEYTWQWQDGSADSTYLATTNVTGQIIRHTFTNLSPNRDQDYNVTMRVQLLAPFPGCFKFSSKKVTVNSIIVTNVIPDKTDICSGETVRFTNQSLGVTSHRWFWREPSTVQTNDIRTTPGVSYILNNTGSNNPQLIEVVYQANNGNCPAADVVTVIKVYKGVTASFNEGVVPPFNSGSSTVTFTNTSTPFDITQFRYDWVFGLVGDASPASLTQSSLSPIPVVYSSPGSKEIILTVTNTVADGLGLSCKAEARKTITIILPPLVASFDIDPKEVCFPASIKLKNVVGTGFVHEWKVLNKNTGASFTSNVPDPIEFKIGAPGQYTVSYKTSIPATGQVALAPLQDVTIYDLPLASFDLRPDIVFVPDTEMSTFNFTTGATDYEWDFGDGGKSDQFEPKYTYLIEGKYDVTLIAKNDHGNGVVCKDTLSRQIVAKQGGQAKIPNAFTPNTSGPSPDGRGANGTFNDVFLPLVKGVPNDQDAYNLQIYDRWGNLIFESTSSTRGWDGYNKDGKLMPAGVYVYKLTLRFSDSQRTTQVGDVTMIH